jgi:hypothetical protein
MMLRFTTVWLAATLSLGGLGVGAGCGSKSEPTPATKQTATPPTKTDVKRDRGLSGRVRLGDVMMPVEPIVIHEPRMDLFPQCQTKRDAEKKIGNAIPLCFNLQKRPASTIKVMRVEVYPLVTGKSIRMLAAHNEGAHFFVEPNGTPYQILDLMYAARRGDGYPGDEIRVISAARDSHLPLAAALRTMFPKLEVLELPAQPYPPPAKPKPPAKADTDAIAAANPTDATSPTSPTTAGDTTP